jgi:hypothetical protein
MTQNGLKNYIFKFLYLMRLKGSNVNSKVWLKRAYRSIMLFILKPTILIHE